MNIIQAIEKWKLVKPRLLSQAQELAKKVKALSVQIETGCGQRMDFQAYYSATRGPGPGTVDGFSKKKPVGAYLSVWVSGSAVIVSPAFSRDGHMSLAFDPTVTSSWPGPVSGWASLASSAPHPDMPALLSFLTTELLSEPEPSQQELGFSVDSDYDPDSDDDPESDYDPANDC